MWLPEDAPMWGEFSEWAVWPGSLDFSGSFEVEFRLTLGAGAIQGVIYELAAVLDAPEIAEDLDDVAVSPGGTRLNTTNTYSTIKSVQLTLQGTGGTGVSARVLDKDADLGPLVEVIDSSGASVAGVVDAHITGF